MRARPQIQALRLQEDEEGAGGDVVAIFGDGSVWVIIKPSHQSPPVSPTSGQNAQNVSSGCGIRTLENF